MKKNYILMTALLIGTAVSAQTNLGFENWSGSPEMADDWTAFSANDSVSKTTSPLSIEGDYSMLIANTMFKDISNQDSLGGSFVSQAMLIKPDSIKMAVAINIMGTDTAVVSVGLYSGGSYIGALSSQLNASLTAGTYGLSFDLTPSSYPAFDAITVSFYSSKTPSNAGTFIVVDAVQVFGPDYAEVEVNEIDVISLYPNPASLSATINIGNNNAESINIIDMTGRIVESITVTSNKETFDVSNYNNGVYFYQVISKGVAIKTEKFIVTK